MPQRPWFKLWPEKLLTADFFVLSADARSVLLHALLLTHRAEEKGMLATLSSLQVFTGIPLPRLRKALADLRGLIEVESELVVVPLYHEMQKKVDKTGTERVARWRAERTKSADVTPDVTPSVTPNVTPDVTPCNGRSNGARGTEVIDTPSVDSSESTPGGGASPPQQPVLVLAAPPVRGCLCADGPPFADEDPVEQVDAFLATFANCRTPQARDKHRPTWLGWLREMHAEGHDALAIWAAFAAVHADAKHAPLHTSRAVWAALRLASRAERHESDEPRYTPLHELVDAGVL